MIDFSKTSVFKLTGKRVVEKELGKGTIGDVSPKFGIAVFYDDGETYSLNTNPDNLTLIGDDTMETKNIMTI